MLEQKQLNGRVAIVTGAGRNIGRAIAHALSREGAAVVVNVRSNETEANQVVRELKALGSPAVAQTADVADPNAVAKLADAAIAEFGRIDILVNNAAARHEISIDAMTYEDWRRVMDVTLDGAFHCVKSCLPALKQNGGRIVNIGGMSAHIGAKHRAHVMAAKLGLVGFTRGLAHDLAADGVTVNCVVPGGIDTWRPDGSPTRKLAYHTLTGKRGAPHDVAAAVLFLCLPAANHITGQTMHANGGAYLS